MERVRTQQRWVVVSLSALNAALLIASDRPQALSAEEQEDEEERGERIKLKQQRANEKAKRKNRKKVYM